MQVYKRSAITTGGVVGRDGSGVGAPTVHSSPQGTNTPAGGGGGVPNVLVNGPVAIQPPPSPQQQQQQQVQPQQQMAPSQQPQPPQSQQTQHILQSPGVLSNSPIIRRRFQRTLNHYVEPVEHVHHVEQYDPEKDKWVKLVEKMNLQVVPYTYFASCMSRNDYMYLVLRATKWRPIKAGFRVHSLLPLTNEMHMTGPSEPYVVTYIDRDAKLFADGDYKFDFPNDYFLNNICLTPEQTRLPYMSCSRVFDIGYAISHQWSSNTDYKSESTQNIFNTSAWSTLLPGQEYRYEWQYNGNLWFSNSSFQHLNRQNLQDTFMREYHHFNQQQLPIQTQNQFAESIQDPPPVAILSMPAIRHPNSTIMKFCMNLWIDYWMEIEYSDTFGDVQMIPNLLAADPRW